MAGRRGARAGRGWDAIPPRPDNDDSSGGEIRRGASRRGNAVGRRRPPSPTESGADSGHGSETETGADRGHRFGVSSGAEAQSESERAREICLRQLSTRPRTRAELAKALAKQEISAEVIAEVLDRYDEVGIIDDAAFAQAWVSSRHQGRGLARRVLAHELRQHGVDTEVAAEALEALDPDEEAATARALVDRKLRTTNGPPDTVFRRLVGMLARKGYPAGVAIGVVKDALAARDAEAAEFAEQIDADAMANEADSLN